MTTLARVIAPLGLWAGFSLDGAFKIPAIIADSKTVSFLASLSKYILDALSTPYAPEPK